MKIDFLYQNSDQNQNQKVVPFQKHELIEKSFDLFVESTQVG